MDVTPGPEYTGLDKYPGWTATVITIIITAIFIGALFGSAGDHGGHGAAETHSEEAH